MHQIDEGMLFTTTALVALRSSDPSQQPHEMVERVVEAWARGDLVLGPVTAFEVKRAG